MKALWSGQAKLHPTFDRINRCLEEDWFLLPYELRLQRAHAKALLAAKILSSQECDGLQSALGQIEGAHLGNGCPESEAEDIHTWIEWELTRLAGDAGRKIHTARSRNDQVATLLKLYLIDSGDRLVNDTAALMKVACEQAIAWSELTFPLHTHQQFAAPGSVGAWALRYASALSRVQRHAAHYVADWRRYCPLGAGAVAGSSIPIDRQVQAAELGFDQPSLSALDATSSRDECLEFMGVGVQLALQLQSFATDVILFSQTPLNWTDYPPAFATGSSMMPNKVNPDAMELLRGEANSVIAGHAEVVSILKGLPSGFNRDYQCIKPIVRNAAEKLHDLCELTREFLGALGFRPDRLAASLRLGHIEATLRMEEKVKAGMPLREAHRAVAAELESIETPEDSQLQALAAEYQTTGCASPAETRRVAEDMLAELK